MFKLQKKSIRFITSSSYREHTEPLFERLRILQMNQVYILKVSIFMFKCYRFYLPDIFDKMFVRNKDIHNYETRSKLQFCVPSAKLVCLRQSMRVKGVYWWNFFHNKITHDCSLNVFKLQLRKYLHKESLNYV